MVRRGPLLGRQVAIKVLAERFAQRRARGPALQARGAAAARVSAHPHVVTIYDVGDSEPGAARLAARPFIVMEYLAGGTRRRRAALSAR